MYCRCPLVPVPHLSLRSEMKGCRDEKCREEEAPASSTFSGCPLTGTHGACPGASRALHVTMSPSPVSECFASFLCLFYLRSQKLRSAPAERVGRAGLGTLLPARFFPTYMLHCCGKETQAHGISTKEKKYL